MIYRHNMSGDSMTFPDSVEEFMEEYKIVDTDHVYTNGMEFVPIFRMRQWFDHIGYPEPPKQYGWICPVCGRGLSPFATVCGCQDKWEITC